MILEIALLLGTVLFLYFVRDNYFPKVKLPPGPLRLPLIGNALVLLKNRTTIPPFVKFHHLSQKYGPVAFMRLLNWKIILTDDFDVSKQILNSEVWVDRPFNARIGERSFGKQLGIIFSAGDAWKEMRRFSIRTLRDFGMGKQSEMQTVIDEEVNKLLSKVDQTLVKAQKEGNEPLLETKHLFTMPVLNILWSMVSNIRTPEDDAKMHKLITLVDNLTKANPVGGNLLSIFPFLRFIFPNWSGHAYAQKCYRELQEYFREILEKRRREGSYKEDKRDFIDMFVEEIDKHKKLGSQPNHYTDEQFITTIYDLFGAGSETSSNTMEFAIYFVMRHPSVQEKVFQEIETVIGQNRGPNAGDRNVMPYTEATLLEVQRLATVLPIIVRCPTDNCKIKGYDISKGSTGIINLYGIHMNQSFWGDPYAFRPERFLDNMKIIPERASRVIPFGAGKRLCLGEQLARTSIFIYFTSVIQKYKFLEVSSASGHAATNDYSNLKEFVDVGFTLSPKAFITKVEKRN